MIMTEKQCAYGKTAKARAAQVMRLLEARNESGQQRINRQNRHRGEWVKCIARNAGIKLPKGAWATFSEALVNEARLSAPVVHRRHQMDSGEDAAILTVDYEPVALVRLPTDKDMSIVTGHAEGVSDGAILFCMDLAS